MARDLSWSTKACVDLVWPAIGDTLEGRIVPVEAVAADRFAHDLDVLAGIDFYERDLKGQAMRGLACRVQQITNGQKSYDTFTLRCQRDSGAPTELEKRLWAYERLAEGWMLPGLAMQAYVLMPEYILVCVGVCPYQSLLEYILTGEKGRDWFEKTNRADVAGDTNRFVVVPWTGMKAKGLKIGIWPRHYQDTLFNMSSPC